MVNFDDYISLYNSLCLNRSAADYLFEFHCHGWPRDLVQSTGTSHY